MYSSTAFRLLKVGSGGRGRGCGGSQGGQAAVGARSPARGQACRAHAERVLEICSFVAREFVGFINALKSEYTLKMCNHYPNRKKHTKTHPKRFKFSKALKQYWKRIHVSASVHSSRRLRTSTRMTTARQRPALPRTSTLWASSRSESRAPRPTLF